MKTEHRWALAVLALAQLMVVLDATIVNIALPAAQQELGFTDTGRQWIVTGYALAFGSLLLIGGRLSDLLGRRTMLLTGFTGFAVASTVGGFSGATGVLIAARVGQGVFAAALAPAALSLLSTTFTTPTERAKAFAIYGSVTGSGSAIGLLLGGSLTEYASWRWCLLVNLLFAAAGIAGTLLRLPATPADRTARMDWPGAITAVTGLVALVYGLGNAADQSWAAPHTYLPIGAGMLLLVLFVAVQTRVPHPLLPLRVVLDRTRGGAYLAVAFTGAGMFAVFLFLTYYLTGVLGFSAIRSGLAFLPLLAGIMISAIGAGRALVPRVGPRPLVPAGALVAAAGLAWLTRLDLQSDYATGVLPGLFVAGLGMGLIFSPTQNAATSAVAPADAGVASAMVNTAQQIGGALGIALLTSIAATTDPTDPTEALAVVFWTAAGIFAACAVIAALTFRSGPLQHSPQGDTTRLAAANAVNSSAGIGFANR
ncbi:MFS transporter [Actinoplanes couchii]|uniref:MFS transporter n=1 Tax=Actinoplanes couchii TaxID=403638 RepID=A0ABQ3XP14_9ACTN|nr:MFS transporter [Actinoplanes couchii]MDR6318662.1 EmrB/QacA subfamily drug resistance transporter [Actinoplanes couchii]GID60269.1 MFS transporter [Actinoplanes couchii]